MNSDKRIYILIKQHKDNCYDSKIINIKCFLLILFMGIVKWKSISQEK